MPKVRYNTFEIIHKSSKKDIKFNLDDVQTKNPRNMGKTPLYLYTRDPLTRNMKPKKHWWENNNK